MTDHDHPVCNECAGKIKHKIWGEKVVRRRAYDEKIVEISTQTVSYIETYKTKRGEDAELLCKLLHDAPMSTRRAILNCPDNQNLLYWYADCTDAALKHFGFIISAEERNRLMHATNGNRGP